MKVFMVKAQYLKDGKYWAPIEVAPVQASGIAVAAARAARSAKRALGHQRTRGLCLRLEQV